MISLKIHRSSQSTLRINELRTAETRYYLFAFSHFRPQKELTRFRGKNGRVTSCKFNLSREKESEEGVADETNSIAYQSVHLPGHEMAYCTAAEGRRDPALGVDDGEWQSYKIQEARGRRRKQGIKCRDVQWRRSGTNHWRSRPFFTPSGGTPRIKRVVYVRDRVSRSCRDILVSESDTRYGFSKGTPRTGFLRLRRAVLIIVLRRATRT